MQAKQYNIPKGRNLTYIFIKQKRGLKSDLCFRAYIYKQTLLEEGKTLLMPEKKKIHKHVPLLQVYLHENLRCSVANSANYL